MEKEWIFNSSGPDQTLALAGYLGHLLQAGDTLFLVGDLGVGKTTFTQGLATALGVPPEIRVNSPTFALAQEYHGRLDLYHVDLYRIEHAAELDELGIDDLLQRQTGITVIEWADKTSRYSAADHIAIQIDMADEEARIFHITAQGERGLLRLREWRKAADVTTRITCPSDA